MSRRNRDMAEHAVKYLIASLNKMQETVYAPDFHNMARCCFPEDEANDLIRQYTDGIQIPLGRMKEITQITHKLTTTPLRKAEKSAYAVEHDPLAERFKAAFTPQTIHDLRDHIRTMHGVLNAKLAEHGNLGSESAQQIEYYQGLDDMLARNMQRFGQLDSLCTQFDKGDFLNYINILQTNAEAFDQRIKQSRSDPVR